MVILTYVGGPHDNDVEQFPDAVQEGYLIEVNVFEWNKQYGEQILIEKAYYERIANILLYRGNKEPHD